MKVNPIASEEKSLLLAPRGGKTPITGGTNNNRSRVMNREEHYKCNKLLRVFVGGKYSVIIMSFITLYALFGVSLIRTNLIG